MVMAIDLSTQEVSISSISENIQRFSHVPNREQYQQIVNNVADT